MTGVQTCALPIWSIGQFDNAGGIAVTARSYQSEIEGRRIEALVMELRLSIAPDAAPSYSCEIADPLAPAVSQAQATGWARRAPDRLLTTPGGGFVASWTPGLAKGNDETMVSFTPAAGESDPPGARRGLVYSAGGTVRRRGR